MADETKNTEQTTPDEKAPEQTKDDSATEAVSEEVPADQTPATEAPPAEPTPEPKKCIPAPPLPEGVHYIWGTGRRKAAVARVRIRPGTGQITINKRDKDVFFVHEKDRSAVMAPLVAANMETSWDVFANVKGGGSTGQAGAVMLGLARALTQAAPDCEHTLRDKGLMTRDARMVERKKYGQKGARRRYQFSKR